MKKFVALMLVLSIMVMSGVQGEKVQAEELDFQSLTYTKTLVTETEGLYWSTAKNIHGETFTIYNDSELYYIGMEVIVVEDADGEFVGSYSTDNQPHHWMLKEHPSKF